MKLVKALIIIWFDTLSIAPLFFIGVITFSKSLLLINDWHNIIYKIYFKMKNIFFLALLVFGLGFSSCSKDDDDEVTSSITATVDGNAFEATTITAISTDDLGSLIVFIAGKETSTGNTIGLNIPTATPLNTTIPVDENDFGITFTDADDIAFFTEGELTLIEHDEDEKVMSGTFSFNATNEDDDTDVRAITNGSFTVVYL